MVRNLSRFWPLNQHSKSTAVNKIKNKNYTKLADIKKDLDDLSKKNK